MYNQGDNYLFTPPQGCTEIDQILSGIPEVLHIKYKKAEIFIKPGQHVSSLCYIHRGRTGHYMLDMEGNSKLLYSLCRGWFFGETPLVLERETNLLSIAEEDSELFLIPTPIVDHLMCSSPVFANAIRVCQSKKLLIMRYEIANLAFNPCKDRILTLLLYLADNKAGLEWLPLNLRLTHSKIGEIVGGTRVTVSRNILDLCKEGYIRMYHGRIQVNAAKMRERNREA